MNKQDENLNYVKHSEKRKYYLQNKENIVNKVKEYQKENIDKVVKQRKKSWDNKSPELKLWYKITKLYKKTFTNYLITRNLSKLYDFLEKHRPEILMDKDFLKILTNFCEDNKKSSTFKIYNGQDVIIDVVKGKLKELNYGPYLLYREGLNKKNNFYKDDPLLEKLRD